MAQLDLGKVVGDAGKSAYQIAVDNGFIGDEQAWLNSLKGKTPVKGVDYFTAEDILGIETEILSEIDVLNIEIVETLPVSDIDPKTIYLVPKQGSQGDYYDEYMYINNQWEHIGSTDVDLSNYYNKTQTDTLLAAKQDNLVSGTNIKTINNQSILGNGNIDIEGNEVYISDDDSDIPASAKIFIDESEGTDAYSEVVNSLSGNEIAKAPSVRAVNGASVIVSATEPQGNDRRKVWLRHENIFDNTAQQTFSNATVLTSIPTGIRATLGVATTSAMACIDIGAITDFVGKTIYIKFKCYSSTSKGRIYLGKSNVGQTSRQMIVNSGEINNGEYVISTKITADDTTYPRLFLAIYSNGDDVNSHPIGTYVDYTNLIVTTVEDKEYILNNNGYEAFEPKNEIYSTSEIRIGTWIDGKPIYRKVYTGTLTAEGTSYFYNDITGLSNTIDQVVHFGGYIDNNGTGGSKILNTLPNAWLNATYFPNEHRIRVYSYDKTWFPLNSSYYLVVEYTKTTD